MEFWLLRNNEKHGPYSQEKLVEFAKRGNLSGSDRLWHHGLEGWEAPLSVLPSLELIDSGQQATEAPSPGASLGSQQRQELPEATSEPRRRRSSFLRSGLTWIPLFSGLLVGALGFQPFLTSVVHSDLEKAESEGAKFFATAGTDVAVGHFTRKNPALSWSAGLLVGVVNGLSFGAILGWLAALIGSRGSLLAKVAICSGLGGAIGWVLYGIFGGTPLALLVGFFTWREGLLLGACFAAVHTLDEFRAHASADSAPSHEGSTLYNEQPRSTQTS